MFNVRLYTESQLMRMPLQRVLGQPSCPRWRAKDSSDGSGQQQLCPLRQANKDAVQLLQERQILVSILL